MASHAKRFDGTPRADHATEILPLVEDEVDDLGEDLAEDVGENTDSDADAEFDVGPSDLLETPAADAPVVGATGWAGMLNRIRPLGALGTIASRQLDKLVSVLRIRLAALGLAVLARLPGLGRALLPRLPRLGVTIAAGLLLCASFPPVGWWWAAVPAFALLAWVLKRPATTVVGGLGYSFVFGLAFYLPLLPWVSTFVGAMPWIALAVVCATFPAIFGLLAVIVRPLSGWPIWFAVLWAAQEWLKSSVPFGGFPWGLVGFGQSDGPFLPLVRLGGVPLLSAAIVLLGCSATAIALEIVTWWQRDRRLHGGSVRSAGSRVDSAASADGADDAGAPPAVVLPAICMCLVMFATVVVWPPVRHAGVGSGNEPTVTVAAVQGNVPRLGLDFNAQRRAVLDNHVRETLRLADDVHAGRAPQPQFVVWPEDSSDVDPLVNADAAAEISEAARALDAPILVGTVLDVAGRSPDAPEYTNTVIVWNPRTGPADRHNKQIVQPFGEYLPWPGLFRHLSGFAVRAGHLVPGNSIGVVHAAGIPVGVATCWEVIFDRAVRKSVRNGAQVLATPSNNATFNQTMSQQHLAFDKVRAVEFDRYVVVAGTVGISAVIAPDGRELDRTDFFTPAYLDTHVRLKTTLTPAARWGPILQWLLVAVGVAVVAVAIRQNGWLTRPRRLRFRGARKPAEPLSDPDDDELRGENDDYDGDDGDGDEPPDENDLFDDPTDEGGHDTPPGEGGRHSARPGPHRGDI